MMGYIVYWWPTLAQNIVVWLQKLQNAYAVFFPAQSYHFVMAQ